VDRLISIGKASTLLDVSIQTLREWDTEGKLKAVRTEGGHRRYRLSDIQRLQGIDPEQPREQEVVVAYCRVSSNDQKKKGDLDRQKGRVLIHCSSKGYYVPHVLSEVASGMSDSRPKLKTLFKLVSSGEVDRVVVEHKDRLTRFLFKVFVSFFESHGVQIECVEDVLGKSYEEELVEDMLTLMSSFASKIYGKRSAEIRRKKKELEDAQA
jgi:excisionase family DNA binding protein